jgi:trimeric autotransporter adhesin
MRRIYLLFFACCASLLANAQSILIDPNGDGGMEGGNTVASNGWTVVNDGPGNQWVAGSGAKVSGSRGVYIGTPTLWTGASVHNVCHFYKDITVPTGSSNVSLTFQLKQTTLDDGFDFFSVYTSSTSAVPVAHVVPDTGFTEIFSNTSIDLPAFTTIGPIDLSAFAGSTFRLTFTYNTTDGVGPPLSGHPALDNISLTYDCAAPPANTGTNVTCAGQPVSMELLSNSFVGGTWSSSNISKVVISPTTGLIKGVAAGTAIVTYSTGAGCFTTTVVSVNTAVSATSGITQICPGTTTSLYNPSPGGTWSSSNTALATAESLTGVVTGLASGTAIITYQLNPGCYKTTNVTVLNSVLPISGSADLCQGSSSALTCGPSGGIWTSSNTAAATITSTGVVTGVNVGTSTISFRVSSGCASTTIVTVNGPAATFSGTANICPGDLVTLTPSTGGGTWASSNPAKAIIDMTSGEVTGVSSGTATITYFITPSCYSTLTQTVKNAPGTIGGNSSVCVAATTNLTCGPAGGIWSSSDMTAGTISTSGIVRGVAPGATTISYLLNTGCVATKSIAVNDIPSAITGPLAVCIGDNVSLGASPGGGTWSSSNTVKAGVDLTSGLVTGMSQGTSKITYMLPGGCYTQSTMVVNPPPAAITGPTTVTAGGAIILYSATGGGSWSSADPGIASFNPVAGGRVYGVSGGTTTVTYQFPATGCMRTASVTVVSGRPGNAAITAEQKLVNEFSVYPNPAAGELTIETTENGKFDVYSIDGKLIFETNISSAITAIDIPADVTPGVYMCKFSGVSGKSESLRLVIQR